MPISIQNTLGKLPSNVLFDKFFIVLNTFRFSSFSISRSAARMRSVLISLTSSLSNIPSNIRDKEMPLLFAFLFAA